MPLPQIEASEPTSRMRRLGVMAVVASFVLIWGYVLYLSFGPGRAEPRDRLADRAYAAEAEATCAPFRDRLEELPFATEVYSPAERADLLDAATDELDSMVAALRTLPPPDTAVEADVIDRWLGDWSQYNLDRREHAAAQRDPNNPRYDRTISVTDRGGFHIDTIIDEFAHINYMDSCETPDDV